jgi:hypothetical protein
MAPVQWNGNWIKSFPSKLDQMSFQWKLTRILQYFFYNSCSENWTKSFPCNCQFWKVRIWSLHAPSINSIWRRKKAHPYSNTLVIASRLPHQHAYQRVTHYSCSSKHGPVCNLWKFCTGGGETLTGRKIRFMKNTTSFCFKKFRRCIFRSLKFT